MLVTFELGMAATGYKSRRDYDNQRQGLVVNGK